MHWTAPFSIPPPRILPVNIQIPTFGFTIVIVDKNGNLTMQVDQPINPLALSSSESKP